MFDMRVKKNAIDYWFCSGARSKYFPAEICSPRFIPEHTCFRLNFPSLTSVLLHAHCYLLLRSVVPRLWARSTRATATLLLLRSTVCKGVDVDLHLVRRYKLFLSTLSFRLVCLCVGWFQ